jgi:hypothetical protein
MFKKVRISSFNYRRMTFLLLAAGSLYFNTSCKDDEKVMAGEPADASAIIPSKDKKYNYKVIGEDGTQSMQVLRVKSVTDSAGLSVYKLETRINSGDDDVVLDWKAYSKSGVTTYEINTPAAFSSILDAINDNRNVKDFRITGFPQFQRRENAATVNSKLTFTGEPIKLYLKLEIIDEEGQNVVLDLESKLVYTDGKVVKVEPLTTPGGTFNCSKWEYSYKYTQKLFFDGQLQSEVTSDFQVTEWTTPGVGVVKSIERHDGKESVTELQKIDS